MAKLKVVHTSAERQYLHLGRVLYDTTDRAGLLSLLEGCVFMLAARPSPVRPTHIILRRVQIMIMQQSYVGLRGGRRGCRHNC